MMRETKSTSFFVDEIVKYRDIVIQCHDVPDADSIASGFALQRLLASRGVKARLIYGGPAAITKPSLLWLIRLLKIQLDHVTHLEKPSLLITIDSQYGAGNITRFEAKEVAIIDHHRQESHGYRLSLINPTLGSCSTLVWHMAMESGFDFIADPNVFTALYYGLYTDTNGLAELRHPLDRDLIDYMPINNSLINKLKYSNLSLNELEIVARALIATKTTDDMGLIKVDPCDANILGFLSDIALQVEQFAYCVVYSHIQAGLKLSIRSCVREVMANELATFLTRQCGSGGGNTEKAGAYLSFDSIAKIEPLLSPDQYLERRLNAYRHDYDLIYCGRPGPDFGSMPRYRKLRIPLGFARTTELFPPATKLTIRTLEGDIDTLASQDLYLMIGIEGEVYPIAAERFHQGYEQLDLPYRLETEYHPTVINQTSGQKKSLLPIARSCVPKEHKIIRAEVLKRDTKVFNNWDVNKYFYGRAGDYIAVPESDHGDIYLINRNIFGQTYTLEE